MLKCQKFLDGDPLQSPTQKAEGMIYLFLIVFVRLATITMGWYKFLHFEEILSAQILKVSCVAWAYTSTCEKHVFLFLILILI